MIDITQNIMIFESFKTPMKRINEDVENKKNEYIFEGICADFSDINRNGRTYDKEEYLSFVNGSLADQIAQMSLAGSLDHPEDDEDEDKDIFTPKMKELSHVILALWYEEATQQVKIKIKLLDTHLGKDAKACADAGMPIYISSRASGIIDKTGQVHLDNIHTYDIVYKPGFKQAKLVRVLESAENNSSYVKIFENTSTMTTYYIMYDYKKGKYSFGETKGSLPEWQEFTGKSFNDQNQASLYCKNADTSTPDDFTPNQELIDKFKSQNIMENVSKQEFESAIGKINESLILISKSLGRKPNKFVINESKFTKRLKRLRINEDEQLDKQDVVSLIVDVTDAPIEDVAKAITDETVEKINAVLSDEDVFDKVVDIVKEDMDELVGEAVEKTETEKTDEEWKQEAIKSLAKTRGISEEDATTQITDELIEAYKESQSKSENENETAESINESLIKKFNRTFRKIYESEETLGGIVNWMHEADLRRFNQSLKKVCDNGETLYFGVLGVGELELKKNTESNTIDISKESGSEGGEPTYTLVGSIPCDDVIAVGESFKSKYIKESEEIGNAENFVATSDAPAAEKVSIIKTFNDLYGADNDIVEGDDEQTVEAFLQEQNQLTVEAVSQRIDLTSKQLFDKSNLISKRVNSVVEYMNVVATTFNVVNDKVEAQGKQIEALIQQLQLAQTRINSVTEYCNIMVAAMNQSIGTQTEQTDTINEAKKVIEKRKSIFENLDNNINRIITNSANGNENKTNKNGVLINEVPSKYSKIFESLDGKIQNEIKAYVVFKNPKSNLELDAIYESLNLEKGSNSALIFESTNFEYSDDFIANMCG